MLPELLRVVMPCIPRVGLRSPARVPSMLETRMIGNEYMSYYRSIKYKDSIPFFIQQSCVYFENPLYRIVLIVTYILYQGQNMTGRAFWA